MARPSLGRFAYRLAQSEGGALLAATVISSAPWALPVRRLVTNSEVVAFRHPRPEVRDHVVIVPRRRVPHLGALPADGPRIIASMIAAAEAAARLLPDEIRVLTINVGVRLDVQQLHGHLLSVRAARRVLAEAYPPIEVPRDNLGALDASLAAILKRLDGGASHVDGSLVVYGLGDATWQLAASIARGGANE